MSRPPIDVPPGWQLRVTRSPILGGYPTVITASAPASATDDEIHDVHSKLSDWAYRTSQKPRPRIAIVRRHATLIEVG